MAANNSPAPPAQTLTVLATGSTPVGYNANAFPSWIRLNGISTPPSISGSTSSTPIITVQIDPSAYSGGVAMQSGTIQVNGPNSTPITVPVTVTVTSSCTNPGTLAATPSSVVLSGSQMSQGVTISGPSGAQITAAAFFGNGNPADWFGLSANLLTAGQGVTVSLLSTSGLATGAQGQIVFTQNGASSSVTVPVTFTAGNTGNGVFTATPGSINVNFTSALDAVKSQLVTITGLNVPVAASVNAGNGPAGWIGVPTQPSGSVPASFQVVVSPISLSTGVTYAGSVTVAQASDPTNFIIIPVTATVGSSAYSFSPNPFTFFAAGGSIVQRNQFLTISGPNNTSIVATAQVNSGGYPWLNFSGSPAAYGTLTNSSLQLIVTVNPANLPPSQTFTGSIVVTENGTTVLNIPVVLTTFPLTRARDFNRSGLSSALLYDNVSGTAYAALSNGNGTYQYIYSLFTSAFDTLSTGDFNGDGKADLVVYNSHNDLAYVGMSNGDGTFSFQSLFWSPGYDFVAPGDLNADGKTDFVLYNSSTGTMYTGISRGDGTFAYKYTLISKGFTFVRLADFAGDGKASLFVYNASNGLAFLGIGDGAGGFAFHAVAISPGYDLIDFGDLNRDGKADMIAYSSATGNAATGIGDGVAGFAFTSMLFTPGFTSVRLGDYTGDGYGDVTLYNKNTGLAYFGTGTPFGTFNFQSLFWSPGYDYVEPQDINGDGKIDVVLYNSTTGTEYTGISNGNGTFSYTYQLWGPGKVLAK